MMGTNNANKSSISSIVYITGAGPGDPELLTIKGKRVIAEADVIIYDSLISYGLLEYAKKGCEIIYAGKRSSKHTLPQHSINDLLVRKAKENKVVVRLKGGDPFLYGRGGEEAEKLYEEGIPFEIIPGISSSFAVPAYAGIPLTHRKYSSAVAIVTGHEEENKEKSCVNWDKIIGASTIVVLMGYKNLDNIVKDMITAGKSENTATAAIQEGTTQNQRVVVATLGTINEKVRKSRLEAPLVLIVGRVVGLRKKINWFEKRRPLNGKRVLVTRATDQASALSGELRKLGAIPIELPLIKIVKQSKNIDEKRIYEAIENFNIYDYVIFTSCNAVFAFFEKMQSKGKDSRIFYGKNIVCVGKATSAALKKYGIIPDILPAHGDFSQKGIIKKLEKLDLKGKNILFPQAFEINKELPEFLASKKAVLNNLVVYETTVPTTALPAMTSLFKDFDPKNPPVDLITFTSYSTVKSFAGCANFIDKGLLKKIASSIIKFGSIGAKTANYALGFGIKSDIISEDKTIDSFVKTIADFYKNKR